MAQVTCPRCQGTFEFDLSVPVARVTCPHCGGVVPSPTAPPPASSAEPAVTLAPYVSPEPPPAEAPQVLEPRMAEEPPTQRVADIDKPFAFPAPIVAKPTSEVEDRIPSRASVDLATAVTRPMPAATSPIADEPQADERTLRHYAAEEKASRRFVKNFIVWVLCAIVMIVLLMLFLTD